MWCQVRSPPPSYNLGGSPALDEWSLSLLWLSAWFSLPLQYSLLPTRTPENSEPGCNICKELWLPEIPCWKSRPMLAQYKKQQHPFFWSTASQLTLPAWVKSIGVAWNTSVTFNTRNSFQQAIVSCRAISLSLKLSNAWAEYSWKSVFFIT